MSFFHMNIPSKILRTQHSYLTNATEINPVDILKYFNPKLCFNIISFFKYIFYEPHRKFVLEVGSPQQYLRSKASAGKLISNQENIPDVMFLFISSKAEQGARGRIAKHLS